MTTWVETKMWGHKPRNTNDGQPPPGAGKRQARILPRISREHSPADTLISDLQPPALQDDIFLLLEAVQDALVFHDCSPRTLIHPRALGHFACGLASRLKV